MPPSRAGVFLAAWMVRATLRKLKFEAFDRHLGMVLGGLEGALLGLVVTLFVVSLAPQTRGPIFASPTGQVVGQLMAALGPVLPEEARGVLAPFWSGAGRPGRRRQDRRRRLAATARSSRGTRDPAAAPASLDGSDRGGRGPARPGDRRGRGQGVRGAVAGGADDGTVERR